MRPQGSHGLIALADDHLQGGRALHLEQAGVESIDAARRGGWGYACGTGFHTAQGGFPADEPTYRRG
jgi:hypothetical protein